MDVRMPDGTVIRNVPEGTTKSELQRKLSLMNNEQITSQSAQTTNYVEKPQYIKTLENVTDGIAQGLQTAGVATEALGQGIKTGGIQLLETPYDIANNVPRLFNLLPGEQGVKRAGDYLGLTPNPFHDATQWANAPDKFQPENNPERYIEAGLEFVGEAIAPSMTLKKMATTAVQNPRIMNSVERFFLNPYMQNSKKAVTADMVGAFGSGVGSQYADDQDMGPIAKFLTTMLSGTAANVSTGALASGKRKIMESGTTYLPGTTTQVKKQALQDAVDMTDEVVTRQGINPDYKQQAIDNINSSIDDAGTLGVRSPTLGPASGDTGLSMLEVKMRNKNPLPFMDADQGLRSDIAHKFSQFQNEAADVTAPQRASKNIIDQRIAGKENYIDKLSKLRIGKEDTLKQTQDQAETLISPVASRRGEQAKASRLLNEQIGQDKGALSLMTQMRKSAIDAVDPDGTKMVDTNDLGKSIIALNDDLNKYALKKQESGLSPDFVNRVEGMVSKIKETQTGILDEFGNPLSKTETTGGKVSLKDIQDMRKPLPKMISDAQKAQQFDLADRLKAVGENIDTFLRSQPDEAVQTALKANDEYMQFFGKNRPTNRAFRDLVQRNVETGKADPDNIADMFLNSTKAAKEDLDKLREIVPDQKALSNAEEMYFDAILAKKDINPKNIRGFISDNKDILPDSLKTKYENMVQELMGNRQTQDSLVGEINQLKREIRNAEKDLSQTTRDLQTGPHGKISSYDPDKYADSILSAKDSLKQADQVLADYGNNKEAVEGIKEAIVRSLKRKVSGTDSSGVDMKDIDAIGRPVVHSKLANTLEKHREVLSKFFSPEEMNDLNRIHALMAKQGKLAKRANIGSDTAEKLSLAEREVMDIVEIALKLQFGGLEGGNKFRNLKLAMRDTFGTGKGRTDRMEQVLMAMTLDPKVASHVLSMKPRDIATGKWVSKLDMLIAADKSFNEE